MKAQDLSFNSIVAAMYDLPLNDKLELMNLLEHNVADERRNEIAGNFKNAQAENQAGKLKFSNNIDDLKKML